MNKKEKYEYLKNVYLLSQGDYDSTRLEKTFFVSDYFRNVKNGLSNSYLFLPSTFKYTLIDQMSDELIEGNYEYNTGMQIEECFKKRNLDPKEVEMILIGNHGVGFQFSR